jgi:hypothetical protein
MFVDSARRLSAIRSSGNVTKRTDLPMRWPLSFDRIGLRGSKQTLTAMKMANRKTAQHKM